VENDWHLVHLVLRAFGGAGMVSERFPLWRLTESRSGRKAALKRLNSRRRRDCLMSPNPAKRLDYGAFTATLAPTTAHT
jgi:hypothetical protein